MGFEEPVKDLKASTAFATALGFDAENEGQNVRLSIPSNQDVTVVLRPTREGSAPQFLLPVGDARKAADVLREAGLKVERDGKLVFARDPDGNTFVLMETVKASHRSMIPFGHKAGE